MDQFISWFLNHKSPVIHDSMLHPIRKECGPGSPPITFTTNACETANAMLKHEVHYKCSDMVIFLNKLSNLIHKQECEVERAIIGHGKYELQPQYKSFQVSEVKWFTMSTTQREQHVNKVADASVLDFTFSDGGSVDNDVQPQHFGQDIAASSSLSVDVNTVATIVRAPLTCLEGTWKKAVDLLKTKDLIVPAPGVDGEAKFVLSYTRPRPHLVVPKKGGGFSCNENCLNWKAPKICSHSVAVAEMSGKLVNFIEYYRKSKHTSIITRFAHAITPKGRGWKGGECPRKQKAPTVANTIVRNPNLLEGVSQPSTDVISFSSQSVLPVYDMLQSTPVPTQSHQLSEQGSLQMSAYPSSVGYQGYQAWPYSLRFPSVVSPHLVASPPLHSQFLHFLLPNILHQQPTLMQPAILPVHSYCAR